MGETMQWAAAVVLLALAGTVHAGDIYACQGEHGEKVYQNTPCQTTAKQLEHRQYDPSMARAADGSAGATERIYTEPPDTYYGADAQRSNAPASSGFDYSSGSGADVPRAPAITGGIGSSAYQRGEIRGTRCVTARGRVYYTAGACGTSVTYAGTAPVDWHKDQVGGIPGAVMVAPNQALNPMTGQIVRLEAAPTAAPIYHRSRDAGTAVDANEACAGARKAAAGRFNRKADRQVQELCRSGRSLYDQPRSGGIP